MSKHPVIKPGEDLWQWAVRTDTTVQATPETPASPSMTHAERGILVRLWFSLRGMIKQTPPTRSIRARRVPTPHEELSL